MLCSKQELSFVENSASVRAINTNMQIRSYAFSCTTTSVYKHYEQPMDHQRKHIWLRMLKYILTLPYIRRPCQVALLSGYPIHNRSYYQVLAWDMIVSYIGK